MLLEPPPQEPPTGGTPRGIGLQLGWRGGTEAEANSVDAKDAAVGGDLGGSKSAPPKELGVAIGDWRRPPA